MSDDWLSRRRYLQVSGVIATGGLAGCAEIIGLSDDNDIQDADGDGVIDSEDYAPRDASVQRAEQVREANPRTRRQPTEAATDSPTDTATPKQTPANTPTEPDSATLTPQRDTDVVFDFERPSQFNWEITDGSRSDLSLATEAISGSRSLYFKDSSNRVTLRKTLAEPGQISELSFWFKYRSQQDNNFRIQLFGEDDRRIVEIREYGQTVHYKNRRTPGVLNNPVADISQNTWLQVVLSNIDFTSKTLDVSVLRRDGQAAGSVSGIGFWDAVTHLRSIRLVNGLHARSGQPGAADPLWIDDMRIKRSGPSGGTPQSSMRVYEDFEDGDLTNWRIRSNDGQNEFGIANDGHQSQHSLYLHHGGSLENFWVESRLDQVVSPNTISFWFKPSSEDQYTKDAFRFRNGETDVIWFTNHRQNDGLYFRFRNGNDEEDRKRIRDGAITVDVGRFVEIRFEKIDWSSGTIGEVYVDGTLTTTNAPFQNTRPGFDGIAPYSIGGGDSGFRVDDIAWGQ